MSESQFQLLKSRRFLPLFATQALGAFNDNAFKNALAILIIYDLASATGSDGPIIITLATGLFILPFFLFSAAAGQIADKYDKARVIRALKLAEIAVMALAAFMLIGETISGLLLTLFLMGTQSAFFGPLKYSILPQHLHTNELLGGNALVETSTFLAILLGTLFGGLLIRTAWGPEVVAATLIGVALFGFVSAWFIPAAPSSAPDLTLRRNFLGLTVEILRTAAKDREILITILAISWFWLVGSIFLTQFPNLARYTLLANEQVTNFLIALFSVGIGIGSLLSNRLLRGTISLRFVPPAAVGLTLFCLDFFWASATHIAPAETSLIGLTAFLQTPANWRLIFDLVMIPLCGGLFIVPLYAYLQSRSQAGHRARMIASNNIVNAFFMAGGAGVTAVLISSGVTIPGIFAVLGTANGFVAVALIAKWPPGRQIV